MSERFKPRILAHISHRNYSPQRIRQVAGELGVPPEERDAFEEAVQELVEAGQVVVGGSDTLALPPMGREVVGRFKLHPRGFGFLLPSEPNAHGDLFVPQGSTGGALSGDIVRATVVHRRGRGPAGKSPFTGRVVEIMRRANTQFVGTLARDGSVAYILPDGNSLNEPIIIRDPTAKHASFGDKIVVDITRYPGTDQSAEGVITEVLGRTGEPDVETDAVCRAYDLPEAFPDEAVEQAREAVDRYNRLSEDDPEYRKRSDLRQDFLITIDPPDAQDFDDAISIHGTGRGVELGVHIADVAAFVTADSPLDQEGYRRGNSCYLPRRVIPMLPEVLSNGVCSLQPAVPRLARSAYIMYDADAKPVGTRFCSSIIQSAHRLTYLEAQALIEGDPDEARKHAKHDAPYTDRLIDTLRQFDALARRIRKRRLDEGMIVLDLPEVELEHDDTGRVVDAHPEDDAFTHRIIEMFMVEANEAVARVFADMNVPLIRRTHPDPGAHDVADLRLFARVAGFDIPENPTRKELQNLLEAVRGKPASRAINFAVLKTLTKAEYAPALIGHFALASEHYTHFTSPIRRYPDLLVHRAMDLLMEHLGEKGQIPKDPKARKRIASRLNSDTRLPTEQQLLEMGSHCSTTERNAEAAERELRKFLVLQLLEKHVSEEFPGTVTGVTGFGVFIQIDKYLVEGMIRTPDLPGGPAERWDLNSFTGQLVAQRSGRAITIGDQFRVRINKVDLGRREMDLTITDNIRSAVNLQRKMKTGTNKRPRHDLAKSRAQKTRRGKKKTGQTKARRPGRS